MLIKLMLIYCLVSLCNAEFDHDYFWKDYTGGPIPTNALKLDLKTNIYVGQVYSTKRELFPAAIRTSSPLATSNSYGINFVSNKNIKVLCAQMPENFQWVKTNITNYLQLPNLVPSGRFETFGIPAYIGRVYVKGIAFLGVVGRALVCPKKKGVHYTQGPFEVLTYNRPDYTYCGMVCPR